MVKLSIIVPIYNLQDYLFSCIDSILTQDFDDYELILINDGSTDSSGEIIDSYAVRDDRIKIFNQINRGVSVARNLGLENAKGTWICFVDGDDTLYPNSLSVIMKEADICKSDMIIAKSFLYIREQIKNEEYKFDKSFLDKTFDGYKLITEKHYKRGSVCGCVFNRKFLEKYNLRFPVGLKNGEDSIFISLVHLYIKQILFIDQIFYLINERQGSASRSWSFEKIQKMNDNIEFINNYIKKHPSLNTEQMHILHFTTYGVISNIFNNLYYCFSLKNYLEMLSLVKKELKGHLFTGSIPISKRKIKLLNLSLTWFSFTVLLNQNIRQISKK